MKKIKNYFVVETKANADNEEMEQIILRTYDAKGNQIIPAFSDAAERLIKANAVVNENKDENIWEAIFDLDFESFCNDFAMDIQAMTQFTFGTFVMAVGNKLVYNIRNFNEDSESGYYLATLRKLQKLSRKTEKEGFFLFPVIEDAMTEELKDKILMDLKMPERKLKRVLVSDYEII